LVDATLQSIDYNINKHIINGGDQSQKTKTFKFSTSLKAVINKVESPAEFKIPQFQLKENRWTIEGSKKKVKPQSFIEPSGQIDISHAVNIIDCSNIISKIPSKCKSLLMEKCEKCDAIVNSIVSSIEIINCKDCQVQVEKIASTFTIESSENITVFLPAKMITEEFKIFTSKTSQINIKILDDEGVLISELPIPEQFQTKIHPQKPYSTKTEPLSHAGSG
jgi:adenylyl cyclase-associated protein